MTPIILIVDDEPALLKAYSRRFRQRQDIHYAESALAALALLESGAPVSILLTDLHMPGMDGLSLLQKVRSLSPETKRLLMTGAPDEHCVQHALENGVIDHCLGKPFQATTLMELFSGYAA